MTAARHQRILDLLHQHRQVTVAHLQSALGGTSMAVWRDLRHLEGQGRLLRIPGGARAAETALEAEAAPSEATGTEEAKNRIAREACRLFVRQGDTIALEGGSTVAALIDHLPETHVTVLTNSLHVALRVRQVRPQLPVKLPGGWLSAASGNLVGPETLQFVAPQRAATCFLSAAGLDAAVGPTDRNPLEIEVKRALAGAANRVVLLVDASKFGRRSASVLLHPWRVNVVVCDAPPPLAIAETLAAHAVQMVVAEGAS